MMSNQHQTAKPRRARQGAAPTQASIEASKARLREVVTAIAAEVIAETATRIESGQIASGQKPRAAALLIASRRRSAPAKPR